MSTRAARFGRRRRGRRLIGLVLFAWLALLALGTGLLWGCGGQPGDESGGGSPETPSSNNEETTVESAVENTNGETAAETSNEAATDEDAEPPKPYAAIPPPPEAGQPPPPTTAFVEGAEDLSDGPLQENRMVAYYGTPQSAFVGVLGESDPQTMMAQLKEQAAVYSAADPSRPAIPTVELIASIAQSEPGPYGTYLSRMPPETIEQYARLAQENRALLLLDVQIGSSTLADEVNTLVPFLERPYVHLAIDTEYAVAAGVGLGGVSGYQIQEAVEFLDRLVEERNLPDKVVVVHQFASGTVFDKEAIKPTENVQVVLHADGFGSPQNKFSKYEQLVAGEPIQYGGFKLFYTQDVPLLSPQQVLDQDPAPVVISYQ